MSTEIDRSIADVLAENAAQAAEITGLKQLLGDLQLRNQATLADNAALRGPIERLYRWHAVSDRRDYGLHDPGCPICDVARAARTDHPGAALLAELVVARTIVATLRQHRDAGGEVWGSIDRDFAAYDAAVKARAG